MNNSNGSTLINSLWGMAVDISSEPDYKQRHTGLEDWRMGFRNKAFTLIEVLLAVTLSALLLTIVYWTYFSINRSIDAATESQEALETGRILSELIKRDIRGINAAEFPLVAKNREIDGKPAGEIEFVTTAKIDASEPTRLRRVGYALVDNNTGQKILIRKESLNLKDDLNTTAKVFEVSRIITGFQLSFFNGTEWTDTWTSASPGSLPKQIRVTINVSDTKGKTKTFVAEEGIETAPR